MGEWMSADDWLKRYNEWEAEELDRLRFTKWLMRAEWSVEDDPSFYDKTVRGQR